MQWVSTVVNRLRAGTVADLLDRWMGHASPAWSSTTLAQTRSIVEHHLKPLLGDIRVNKLTTIDIDDMYRLLSRCGGRHGQPLTPGTVHRVHVVLHRALTQAVRWEWICHPRCSSITAAAPASASSLCTISVISWPIATQPTTSQNYSTANERSPTPRPRACGVARVRCRSRTSHVRSRDAPRDCLSPRTSPRSCSLVSSSTLCHRRLRSETCDRSRPPTFFVYDIAASAQHVSSTVAQLLDQSSRGWS